MPIDLSGYVNLSDKQLEKMSQVSDADIEKAKLLWKQFASGELSNLLDAETVEELNAGE